MLDLLRLCRLYYSIPMALTYTLTLYYARAGRMTGQWSEAIFSTAALMLVVSAGYVFNDVCDFAVDRTRRPGRPLPAGRLKKNVATGWAVMLMAGGLALGGFCRLQFAAVLAAVAAGLVLYDLFSKRLGAAKQVFVALLMTSIYPLALAQSGGAYGPRAWSLAVFPVWMFLTSFGYEALKDIRDATGDPHIAGRPTPLQRNPRRWRAISSAAIVIGAAFLVGPAFLGCKWLYSAIVPLAMAAGIISTRTGTRNAIRLVYAECFIVGIAAAADVIVLGV